MREFESYIPEGEKEIENENERKISKLTVEQAFEVIESSLENELENKEDYERIMSNLEEIKDACEDDIGAFLGGVYAYLIENAGWSEKETENFLFDNKIWPIPDEGK